MFKQFVSSAFPNFVSDGDQSILNCRFGTVAGTVCSGEPCPRWLYATFKEQLFASTLVLMAVLVQFFSVKNLADVVRRCTEDDGFAIKLKAFYLREEPVNHFSGNLCHNLKVAFKPRRQLEFGKNGGCFLGNRLFHIYSHSIVAGGLLLMA